MIHHMPRRPRRWSKPLLSIVVFTLTLCALEVTLRVVGYATPPSDPSSLDDTGDESSRAFFLRVSENEDVAYELTPGTSGHGWDCEVNVNSLGFRDREYSLDKPPGTYRVVVLGDSVTFGHSVPIEESFTEQLEARVNARGIEVLNLGLGGYDTINEAALLETTGTALDPDLVLVAYCVNDIRVWSPNFRHIEQLSEPSVSGLRIVNLVRNAFEGGLDGARDERTDRESDFEARYAQRISTLEGDDELRLLMGELRDHLEARDEPMTSGADRFVKFYTRPPYVGRIRYGFQWLARIGEEHGFDVVLVFLPYHADLATREEIDLVDRIVGHEARRAGLECMPLGRRRKWESFMTRGGVHPKARGHRILADVLARELSKRTDWPSEAK